MKIYKVAVAVPPGYIYIEIEGDEDGNFKSTVKQHGPGTGCQSEDDDALLEDLLATEVDGFYGGFGEITGEGLTMEGRQGVEEKTKKEQPFAEKPQQAPFLGGGPFGGGGIKSPEREKTPDLGFGV